MTRGRLLLLAALAAALGSAPGCSWWPFGRGTPAGKSAGLTRIEAHEMIARAREQSYADGKADLEEAVRLADAVIADAGRAEYPPHPSYLREAFYIKATAYRRMGAPADAAAAARQGIQEILSHDEHLRATELTTLKMLLPLFVENMAAAGAGPNEISEPLAAWESAVLRQSDPEELAPAREEFSLLREMAQQEVAARLQQTRIGHVVRSYFDLFNGRDRQGLLRLLAPQSHLAKRLAAGGLSALVTDAQFHIYLVSGLSTTMAGEAAKTAVVTGDVLAVSEGGWATLLKSTQFRLVRNSAGDWQILEIIEKQ